MSAQQPYRGLDNHRREASGTGKSADFDELPGLQVKPSTGGREHENTAGFILHKGVAHARVRIGYGAGNLDRITMAQPFRREPMYFLNRVQDRVARCSHARSRNLLPFCKDCDPVLVGDVGHNVEGATWDRIVQHVWPQRDAAGGVAKNEFLAAAGQHTAQPDSMNWQDP